MLYKIDSLFFDLSYLLVLLLDQDLDLLQQVGYFLFLNEHLLYKVSLPELTPLTCFLQLMLKRGYLSCLALCLLSKTSHAHVELLTLMVKLADDLLCLLYCMVLSLDVLSLLFNLNSQVLVLLHEKCLLLHVIRSFIFN
jgi:hypothetical protein